MSRRILILGLCIVSAFLAAQWIMSERQKSVKIKCIDRLHSIEGAKATWAVENNVRSDDAPSWQDLVGNDRYLPTQPVCPQGGTYTIGSLNERARCSYPGHVLGDNTPSRPSQNTQEQQSGAVTNTSLK